MKKGKAHLAHQLKVCAKTMKSRMYHTKSYPLLDSEYVRLRNDWECYCYLEQPPDDEADAWERERNREKWLENDQLYRQWLREYIKDNVEMPEKSDVIQEMFRKNQMAPPKRLETEQERVDACRLLVMRILHDLAMNRNLFKTVSTSLATRIINMFVSKSIERIKQQTDIIRYEPPFEIHNRWEELCFQMQLGYERDVSRYTEWIRKEVCYPVIAETFESGDGYTKRLGNSLAWRLYAMDRGKAFASGTYIPQCYKFISVKVAECVLDEAAMDMMFY